MQNENIQEVKTESGNTLSSLLVIIQEAIRKFGDREYRFSEETKEEIHIDNEGKVVLRGK